MQLRRPNCRICGNRICGNSWEKVPVNGHGPLGPHGRRRFARVLLCVVQMSLHSCRQAICAVTLLIILPVLYQPVLRIVHGGDQTPSISSQITACTTRCGLSRNSWPAQMHGGRSVYARTPARASLRGGGLGAGVPGLRAWAAPGHGGCMVAAASTRAHPPAHV